MAHLLVFKKGVKGHYNQIILSVYNLQILKIDRNICFKKIGKVKIVNAAARFELVTFTDS